MTTQWIGPDDDLKMGKIGFLVEISHATKGWTRFDLRDLPAMTNQSHKPRLQGWCGSNNDVSTYGRGMAKVIRMARNGRALVQRLEGDELQAALEEFGYPDLTEES